MAPPTQTTAPNVTPIRSRLEDEDSRKRKAVATPPRPTPPRTGLPDGRITSATTRYGTVMNPYASPVPKLKPSSSLVPITPGSSAKKKKPSKAPPSASKKGAVTKPFSLPLAELYYPFRENDISSKATEFIGPEDKAAMDAFDSNAYSLMRAHFIRTRETKQKAQKKDDGRMLRSKAVEDVQSDLDFEAITVSTSNTRRLSRYLIEDFLPLPDTTPLLLLIPVSKSVYSPVARKAMSLQPKATQVRMGGILYFSIFGKINRATMGDDYRAGLLSESQLMIAYHRNEGVSISFDGVEDTRLQLSWKDLVLRPCELLMFGAPFNTTRDFYRSFKSIKSRSLLHETWRQLYFESFGDAMLSFSIYSAYMKQRCDLAEESNSKLQDSASKYDGIASSILTLTTKGTGILNTFNQKCFDAIQHSVTRFQDFSIRLIPRTDVTDYVNLVKEKVPALFELFATMRNIDYSRTEKAKLIPVRERQVFFQIVSMFNQRCKICTDWAAIMSIAKKGWGQGKLAASVDSYFGVEISQTTYSRRISKWTENMRAIISQYLAEYKRVLVAFDNIQEGIQYDHQRGGKSGSFKKATSRIAREIVPYLDTSFDNTSHVDITYVDQVRTQTICLLFILYNLF
jgi:hypothetical protein